MFHNIRCSRKEGREIQKKLAHFYEEFTTIGLFFELTNKKRNDIPPTPK